LSEHDDYLTVLAQLERLRRDRGAWAKMRRLVIAAPCCARSPLIEVMNTMPPCVMVRQVTYGHIDPGDSDRKPWSGARRGGQGIVWLAAFEQMAERNAKQYVWCRHRRWAIPAVPTGSDYFSPR
jgi:hypothetical protein